MAMQERNFCVLLLSTQEHSAGASSVISFKPVTENLWTGGGKLFERDHSGVAVTTAGHTSLASLKRIRPTDVLVDRYRS